MKKLMKKDLLKRNLLKRNSEKKSKERTIKEKKSLLSFRVRLIAAFLFFLFLPSLAIFWASYDTADREIRKSDQETMEQSLALVSKQIDSLIDSQKANINLLARQATAAQIANQSPAAQRLLDDLKDANPQIESLVIVSANGGNQMRAPMYGMSESVTDQPWYQDAINSEEVIVTKPYKSSSTGNVVVTLAKGLFDSQGVASMQISLSALTATVNDVHIGETGIAYLVDGDGNYLVHSRFAAGSSALETLSNEVVEQDSGELNYTMGNAQKYAFYNTHPSTGWKLIAEMDRAEVDRAARPILNALIVVLGISALVGIVFMTLMIRSLHRPIQAMVKASRDIGNGDLTIDLSVKRKDEYGVLAEGFNRMTGSLRSVLGEVSETSHQLAASSQELAASSEQTTRATEQLATIMQETATGTIHSNQSLGEAKVLVEEMSRGVKSITNQAEDVTLAAKQVSDESQAGMSSINEVKHQMDQIGASAGDLNEVIQGLGDKSIEIRKIVEVITNIAKQTNILSLNASIEASRAGEHGRGFAVVANEVKELAEQSANSAAQIAKLTHDMEQGTGAASESMYNATKEITKGITTVNEAGERFRAILQSIQEVAAQMGEVSSASKQMDASMTQVGESFEIAVAISDQIAAGAQEGSAASEEQLAAMQEVASSAATLSKIADELQEIIQRFKL
ncbi:methyl-accepting chemotaxis protein [Neobacillus mesonae]|nr:methyl-accepting chemotaxis protein [Neobacillus mesonae]